MGTLTPIFRFVFIAVNSINEFLLRKIYSFAMKIWIFVFTLFGFIDLRLFTFRKKCSANPDMNTKLSVKDEDVRRVRENGTANDNCEEDVNSECERFVNEDDEPKSFLTFRFPRYEESVYRKEEFEPINVPSAQIPLSIANDGSETLIVDFEDEDKYTAESANAVSLCDDHSHCPELRRDDDSEWKIVSSHDNYVDNSHDDDKEVTVQRLEENSAAEDTEEFKYHRESESISVENLKRNSDDSLRKCFVFDDTDYDDFMVSSGSDSDQSLISSSKFSFISSSLMDSVSDGFLSDSDLNDVIGRGKSKLVDEEEADQLHLDNLSDGYEAEEDFSERDEELLQELKKLDNSTNLEMEFEGVSPADSSPSLEENSDPAKDEFDGTELDRKSNKNKSDYAVMEKQKQVVESDNQSNGLETLWEHQHLIEQLKMEIRKVRATGLPTILEESESPRITDDLKPWKIDEKYQQQGTNDVVQKFYKSYRERMRKLDILNYQKMYAIGFLKLKDPLKSFTKHKHPAPAIATVVSQDCWPCKPRKKSEPDPMAQFSRELESDLEMVYVGQLCLSWEFLHWEYGKALDLWDSDPHGFRRYNEVAGEFQKFQVLLQRFLEDEPFKGPRVPNYAKNRCLHRHLLQVPALRDNMKDKSGRGKGSSKDAITSAMLVEILEESIRVLWQFIRSDKDAHIASLNCLNRTETQLQKTEDADAFLEIRKDVQQTLKKLKEVLKNDCCILKKLQKYHQHQGKKSVDRVMCFFSQVDLKLILRVLNMPAITTDQLAWCRSKLNSIKIVNSGIDIEPSFLLFPCA